MGRRKRLNVVRRSSKSQAKAELIGSSNDVNQKNHSINEECAQFGAFTTENAMVSSLNLQSTMGKHKRLNVVLRSGNSEADNQLIDNLIEVNQNNRNIKKDCAQFGVDGGENAVVSSHKHQNTMGRRTRLNVVRSCRNSLTEQQLVDSSNHFNQNNPDIIEDYAQLRGDTGENATLSSFNHQNTIGRRQRLNAVRKNGKSQAKGQLVDTSNDVNQNNHSINEQCANFGRDTRENLTLVSTLKRQITMGRKIRFVQKSGKLQAEKQFIDSSNDVNQNNHCINDKCAQFGRDTRDNAMVSTLHQHTMERCKRLNIVRKSGVSQAKEQVVDNSNDVNQNNHGTKEVCANFGDTREIAMLSSLSHQNTTVRRKRSNASKKHGKSQAKEQFTDRSNDVNQNNYDTRENAMVSTVDHQNTIGRRTRSTAVGNSGKSLSKEQLIDSSNHFNQNNHDISKECAQLGGDTRENAILSNLNHQNTLGRCQRLNVVRKSGKSQAKEQLVDHSNDVNQNNHGVNELCANFGGDAREIAMTSRFNHQNTSVRRKKLSAAQNRGKSQAKEQIIESSNDVNQNNHGIDEECAQFVGNTRENAMVSTIDHQNTMGRRTRLTAVGNSGKSLSKEQLIYSSNHFNQNNHDISEECAQLGGVDTRENAMLSSFNCENISGRHQRMNVGRKSGKSQAEEQLVNRSKDVNQNNHSINELSANFGGDTREIAMPSSINHQNTSVRRKMLNAARKRGKSQANEQIIDNSNGVNQNNQSVNEECAQFGGDTRENVMVSSLNHQTKTVKRRRLNGFQKTGNSQAEKHVIDNENNHEINVECAQFGGDTGENLLLSRLSRQNDQSCPEQQIQEGSHCEYYIPSGRMSISLPKGEKRVRGYTRMSDVWGIPDGEFILVEVDPLGNPIGVEGKKLLNAIGSLVRKHQYAPINYLSWKDMPELYIKNMLELIESKFLFAPKLTDQTKQILKDNMSSKWRQFKHDLKVKGYDESKTEEEMAANIPDTRVDPSQYRALVHHWCSQEAQKISNINKRNRSKYEDSHCMGTKNLPRFIHETIEANGVPPSRAQTYIETRTRKDGTIVTEKAANVIGELKKHMVEATSSHNPQTTQNSTNWENDIFAKVKGPEKRGRVRCLGMVARPANSNVSSTVEVKLHKLENLLGSLVSVLQTRFTEDRQINDVLQAIAQEVPNTLCTPNDSTSGNQ